MTRFPSSPKPQPTAEDLALKAEISRKIHELAEGVTDHNLHRVRRLVDLALRRQVPAELLTHLSYLGRDWYKLADNGPPRQALRIIEGDMPHPALPAPTRKPRSRKT